MTATLTPPTATRAQLPGAPALPQVNLLPPEVRAGRQLRNVKAWLAVALLLVLLVVAMGFVFATFVLRNAETELAGTQDANSALLAQQAQYAEVPQVLGEIAAVEEARTTGMATETLWKPYLAAVAAAAPTEVSLDTFSVVGATPFDPGPAIDNPLVGDVVGTLSFTARSLTLPDTAEWVANLEDVPGFTDPWFTSATAAEEDGNAYFAVSGTVYLTADAYAERFVPEDEATAPAAATEEVED